MNINFKSLLSLGGTRYAGGCETAATTEGGARMLVPHGTVLFGLLVRAVQALPTGTNVVFTLFKNGVATGVTVTVRDTDGTNIVAETVPHSAMISPSDAYCLQAIPSTLILSGIDFQCVLDGV